MSDELRAQLTATLGHYCPSGECLPAWVFDAIESIVADYTGYLSPAEAEQRLEEEKLRGVVALAELTKKCDALLEQRVNAAVAAFRERAIRRLEQMASSGECDPQDCANAARAIKEIPTDSSALEAVVKQAVAERDTKRDAEWQNELETLFGTFILSRPGTVKEYVDALQVIVDRRDRETRRGALEDIAANHCLLNDGGCSCGEKLGPFPARDVIYHRRWSEHIRALRDAEPPAAPSKEFEPFGRDWLQQKKEENERGFGRKS